MTKPTILIYVSNPNEDILKEICAGVEEEGVSFEVVLMDDNIEEITYDSSNASILGTGIGVSNTVAALSLSSLPKGKFVFYLEAADKYQARILGTNAARAVKRKAFKEMKSEVMKP